MADEQNIIEDFFDQIGFRERIFIGINDKKQIYFHIDFSNELADGLKALAFMDKSVHDGINKLISNLEAILEGVGRNQPKDADKMH